MVEYSWRPQAGPQHALITCPVFEIFYGGARGGGKTDGMLGKFGLKAKQYGKNSIGVFFRKTREDLKEAIERSKQIYGPIGATYTDKQWTFPNGARLKFEYLANDKDAENYQGHNYTDVFFEELTHWASPDPVNKLKATLRSAEGVPCQFHATGNPGGPGHQWVKQRYINPAPKGWEILTEDFENPFTGEIQKLDRIFIPSKLTDNRLLMDGDPLYVAKLQQSGSEQLVKAWLAGDWDIVEGAFFDCWNSNLHVLRPFTIPSHWMRFRSGDWGSAKPFSIGWWAVASEDFKTPCGQWIPRGAMVRYREWYGVKKDQGQTIPNVGLKMFAEAVGQGIREREREESISYGVLDPAAFSEDGGPSIESRMGVFWKRADNKRVPNKGAMGGWDQVRSRLEGQDFGDPMGKRPMIYCFSTCVDSIRTIPALQHDQNRVEDLDSDMEDHAADDWRYACMSRPWVKPLETDDKPMRDSYATDNDEGEEWKIA